jgi:ketosteroid isomerase-like protein
MSRENVEIVRHFNTPYEGQNVVPVFRAGAERLGPDPQPDTLLAEWAKDPAYQHMHPEIEWDVTATGAFGTVAHGARELALWWTDWSQAWESYVYRIIEYRDLGDWILTRSAVRARGRGIPVEMLTFELWQVRDGKIAIYRAFLSEQEALEAVGLSD